MKSVSGSGRADLRFYLTYCYEKNKAMQQTCCIFITLLVILLSKKKTFFSFLIEDNKFPKTRLTNRFNCLTDLIKGFYKLSSGYNLSDWKRNKEICTRNNRNNVFG